MLASITFHDNWWAENVDQRMPRTRFGQIHVFNNPFTSEGNSYRTNARFDAESQVENSLCRSVNKPLAPDGNGAMRASGNAFERTSGNTSDHGGSATENSE